MPKSVLISSTYFPPQVGGISSMMGSIAEALGPRRVCCLTGVRAASNESRPASRTYRRPLAFSGPKHVRAIGWGTALTEILLRERPRAVQLATVYECSLGLWMRRRLGMPFLIYAHGNEMLHVLRGPETSRQKHALRSAGRVVCVSRYTAALARRAGVDESRIEVIHPGCDVQHFRPVPATREMRERLLGETAGPVILSVGNLVPRKGHDMVIRAMPVLLGSVPQLTYLIVGDGPCRTDLGELAAALGVREQVRFAGAIPWATLPEMYALGDVFVMPSREDLEACDVEGFGLVYLEANACGLPVVGGRSGGIPDAVEHGVTGLLVDPTDPEALAGAILRLVEDPELARRLGHQGLRRARAEFQWSEVADRVQRVIDDMVERR